VIGGVSEDCNKPPSENMAHSSSGSADRLFWL
jgi:hypothetical protein